MWFGFNRYCFSGKRIPAGFAAGRLMAFRWCNLTKIAFRGWEKWGVLISFFHLSGTYFDSSSMSLFSPYAKKMKIKFQCMNKALLIILFLGLLTFALPSPAQRLMNSSRSTIGYIDDARVLNSSRSIIGYIKDGRVMNSNRATIGYLKDGRVMNSNRSTIGYVKNERVMNSSRSTIGYIEDGRVLNSSRGTIGYFDGVKPSHAALFFFFFFD